MKSLSDISEPAKVHRKMLEKDVQKQCVDWARAKGYLCRKWSSQSQRSVPDYLMFSLPCKFWVEFKAPGKHSTKAQKDEQEQLRIKGFDGFECDNFEHFQEIVRALEHAVVIRGHV